MDSRKDITRINLRLPGFSILNASYLLVEDWSNGVPVRSHWRIWWNPEPGAAIGDGVTTFPLVPDRLLLAPPHVSIRHHLDRPTRSVAMHVEVDSHVTSTVNELFYPELPADFVERLQEIPKSYPRGAAFSTGAGKDPKVIWLLKEIVCRSFQYIPPDVWDISHKDPRVEEAMLILQQKRIAGCSNDELAKAVYLSTNAFIRLFKQEVGVPPQVYLQNIRLDHAARLLQHSDHSVDQIAAECGFCDRNYLTKLFKRRYLVGPAQYRRQDW